MSPRNIVLTMLAILFVAGCILWWPLLAITILALIMTVLLIYVTGIISENTWDPFHWRS